MSRRLILATAGAALALVAGCSSTGGTSSGGSGPAGAGSTAPSVTVSLRGSTLVAPDGHTLYTNTVDTMTKITCTGSCASIWPPVTGTGSAGTGVTASDLGTAARPDGSVQVTYLGHPLYEFTGDKSAGSTKGNGMTDQGGTWHTATVSGAASSPAPAPANPGGGGYGY